VLAGGGGEELGREPGLGFQVTQRLAGLEVLAVEELAGQHGARTLLPAPRGRQRAGSPVSCGAGDAFEGEPDVAGAGAELGGGGADRHLPGDDEAADGIEVDLAGVGSGQVQPGAAVRVRCPGQRLADAQAGEQGGGVAVQRGAQARGEGVGEGLVFYRVLELAAGHGPVRYHNIVAGKRPRTIPPAPPAARPSTEPAAATSGAPVEGHRPGLLRLNGDP
jgi:hypothetical protein